VRGHERSAFVALSRVAVGPGLDTASFEIPGTPSPPTPRSPSQTSRRISDAIFRRPSERSRIHQSSRVKHLISNFTIGNVSQCGRDQSQLILSRHCRIRTMIAHNFPVTVFERIHESAGFRRAFETSRLSPNGDFADLPRISSHVLDPIRCRCMRLTDWPTSGTGFTARTRS